MGLCIICRYIQVLFHLFLFDSDEKVQIRIFPVIFCPSQARDIRICVPPPPPRTDPSSFKVTRLNPPVPHGGQEERERAAPSDRTQDQGEEAQETLVLEKCESREEVEDTGPQIGGWSTVAVYDVEEPATGSPEQVHICWLKTFFGTIF